MGGKWWSFAWLFISEYLILGQYKKSENYMPFVNIKITGGKEAPTSEQKAEIISGVTELLARVLNKNPATTMVIIDEVETDNWGIGGQSVMLRRKQSM